MSKTQGFMQVPEKKPYFDYVKGDIMSVKNMEDLNTLGKTMENVMRLEKREIEELFNLKSLQTKNLPQLVALCIIVPTDVVPKQLNSLIEKILPDLNNLNSIVQNAIAYRYVETALLTSEGRRLYENGIFATLFHDNPAYFAGPYLNLLASIRNPIDVFEKNSLSYTKIPRIDLLTLYYYGINLLLLRKYKKAEQILLRAYKLVKKAKPNDFCNNLIHPIIEKLSLASFLNCTPFAVFLNFFKLTHQPEKFALSLWDLDNPKYLSQIQDPKKFYDYFSKEIIREHTRRVILDFANTTSEMPLHLLIESCSNPDAMEVLTSLKSTGELKFQIKDNNIIKFIKLNFQVQIDNEQNNIQAILAPFK